MKILKPIKVAGKVTSKTEVVDFKCSRCETVMVEGPADPDVGRMMKCPSCGWRSRRPVEAPEDTEEIE